LGAPVKLVGKGLTEEPFYQPYRELFLSTELRNPSFHHTVNLKPFLFPLPGEHFTKLY